MSKCLVSVVSTSVLLMTASVTAQTVAFLGTSPQVVAHPPLASSSILAIGMDAGGNDYYADSAGNLIRVAAGGGMTTLASGLKQPSIAVDYRGDVYVSDKGNQRILSIEAGGSNPVVRARAASPAGIAADVGGNFFYLASGALFELSGNAPHPRQVGMFPGAMLLAYGPATGEDDTLYILSASGHKFTVSTYTYHNATGATATIRSFTCPDAVNSFVVDIAGNLIFSAGTGASTYVFQVEPSGQQDTLVQVPPGLQPTLAMDVNRNLYYADSTGLNEVMKGALNFGQVAYDGRGTEFQQLTLNFSVPSGVTIATDTYGAAPGKYSTFYDADYPPPGSCSPGVTPCVIDVTYTPSGSLGIDSTTMKLFDPTGKQLFQLPLYGRGFFSSDIMFPTGTTVSNADKASLTPNLKSPAGISNDATVIADPGTGTLYGLGVKGLGRPQTVAHSPITGTYAPQSAMAGVLRVALDGTQTRIAQRLVTEPNGVAVDDAGNLYISDRSSIFRVGVDGTETELANNLIDGGYKTVESITANGAGNVYAYFATGGPDGNGGLVKISPLGVATAVALPASVKSAAGLGIDDGGGLYISDSVSHAVDTLRPNGGSQALITGFKTLKGVSGVGGPMVVDQGTDALYGLPALSFNTFFGLSGEYVGDNSIDFGNVPIGGSVSKTYTVLSVGSEPGGVTFTPAGPSDFSITTAEGSSTNGGSQVITVTYKPTKAGAVSVVFFGGTLFQATNDNESFIYLTGTGMAVKK